MATLFDPWPIHFGRKCFKRKKHHGENASWSFGGGSKGSQATHEKSYQLWRKSLLLFPAILSQLFHNFLYSIISSILILSFSDFNILRLLLDSLVLSLFPAKSVPKPPLRLREMIYPLLTPSSRPRENSARQQRRRSAADFGAANGAANGLLGWRANGAHVTLLDHSSGGGEDDQQFEGSRRRHMAAGLLKSFWLIFGGKI
jgi:hypothetical protein